MFFDFVKYHGFFFQCDSPGLPAAKKSKTQADDGDNKVLS